MLFWCEYLWGKDVFLSFTLPGGHWSVHTLCQCLSSCHRHAGGRWSSAIVNSCIGFFFLTGGFLARSPYAAGSLCGKGRLDGPSPLELCWSRVAPGEENREEEEEEVRIQAWALLPGSSGFLSARDMAEMPSCRAPCPWGKEETPCSTGVQSLLKQEPCVKFDPAQQWVFLFHPYFSEAPRASDAGHCAVWRTTAVII